MRKYITPGSVWIYSLPGHTMTSSVCATTVLDRFGPKPRKLGPSTIGPARWFWPKSICPKVRFQDELRILLGLKSATQPKALLWPNLDDRETIFIEISILIVPDARVRLAADSNLVGASARQACPRAPASSSPIRRSMWPGPTMSIEAAFWCSCRWLSTMSRLLQIMLRTPWWRGAYGHRSRVITDSSQGIGFVFFGRKRFRSDSAERPISVAFIDRPVRLPFQSAFPPGGFDSACST